MIMFSLLRRVLIMCKFGGVFMFIEPFIIKHDVKVSFRKSLLTVEIGKEIASVTK